MSKSINLWRIERNEKLQLRVVRDAPQGREVRRSAGGKESSFKTWAAASRCMRRLNEDERVEAELRAKYAGLPPMADARGAIGRAIRGE